MKEIVIDAHSTYCEIQSKKAEGDELFCRCENYPETFLFLIGLEFYLITYNSCLHFGNRIQFIEDIVKTCLGKTKVFERYEVNRHKINDDLKEYRLRGTVLKKYIEQINYLYQDASGREYAITTKADYIEAIVNNDALKESYLKSKKHLETRGLNYHIEELTRLYTANIIQVEEIEVVKSVASLIDKINNYLKQNENGIS